MKLIRWADTDKVTTGIVIDDKFYDTSNFGEDYNESFFATDGLKRLQEFININKESLPLLSNDVRLSSPVARPSKIVCIGLNYVDHAIETKAAIPPEPIIFFKSTTALCGPNDDIVIPKNSIKTDWEVELAVVIKKRASYADEADAMDYV